MQVNNKDFDDIGCTYSSSTYEITITQGGVWIFTANAGVVGSGANEYGSVSIQKNGTLVTSERYRGNGSLPAIGNTTAIIEVKAGDKIRATIAGSASVTNNSRVYQNFSGACLHPYFS